jgi:hypothetical protein
LSQKYFILNSKLKLAKKEREKKNTTAHFDFAFHQKEEKKKKLKENVVCKI